MSWFRPEVSSSTFWRKDQQRWIAMWKSANGSGFDIIEVSTGFITIPTDDWLRLVEKVQKAGLKAKPEVGIQFGAGGATAAAGLETEGTRDPEWAISQAKRFVDA